MAAKPAKAPAKAKAKAGPAKKAEPKAPELRDNPHLDSNLRSRLQAELLTPDEQAHVGFFAKAIAGPHHGRYGVIRSLAHGIAVLATRDDNDENLLVNIEHLRPDVAGKR